MGLHRTRVKYIWIYAWIWTIPTTNMTYNRLQNYTKNDGWQTWNTNIRSCACCVFAFDVVIWCVCSHKCTSLIIFGQVICSKIPKCKLYTTQNMCHVRAKGGHSSWLGPYSSMAYNKACHEDLVACDNTRTFHSALHGKSIWAQLLL